VCHALDENVFCTSQLFDPTQLYPRNLTVSRSNEKRRTGVKQLANNAALWRRLAWKKL